MDELALQWPALQDELHLVHGLVIGTVGPVRGREYGHAWVELGNNVVIDGDEAIALPRSVYYDVGQVHETHSYSLEEMRNELLEHEHYGPWHLPGSIEIPDFIRREADIAGEKWLNRKEG